MSYSPEAMQKKRLSIAALIEKINANNVIGEIIDDYEKERSQTVARQKEQVQKEQLEKEAQIRQELEEQRLLEEEQARQEAAERENNLSALVSTLAKKTKPERFHLNFPKTFSRRDEILEEEQEPQEEQEAQEVPKESWTQNITLFVDKMKSRQSKEKKVKKPTSTLEKKKERPSQTSDSKKISISYADDIIDEIYEEPEIEATSQSKKTPEEIRTEVDRKREAIRSDIIRAHESTSIDEVYRFRCALERLSEDSYNLTYVYAACIIDKDFESVSVIRTVTMLAELIEESGDSLDFYFAYIVTNKGVQHYGCDEALSDVTLAMEDIRNLFMQKKGKVTPEQLQSLNSLRIFKTIYYEDAAPRMRR